MANKSPERSRADAKRHYHRRREEILRALQEKRDTDPLHKKQVSAAWREKNPEYYTQYLEEHRAAINARRRERYATDGGRRREKGRLQAHKRNKRYADDPKFNIECRLRSRVTEVLRQAHAQRYWRIKHIVGCTIQELMAHLESLFMPGMTWANRALWHIDHRIPCAKFNLTDPEQQRRCFHFSNLQPLWGPDNLRKGSSAPAPRADSKGTGGNPCRAHGATGAPVMSVVGNMPKGHFLPVLIHWIVLLCRYISHHHP